MTGGKGRWQWWVIGGLAVLAFTLGYEGFRIHGQTAGERRSLLDLIYLTLQLFGLESGSVSPPVPWQLEVARFLAPFVAAWTLFKGLALLFREQFQLLRLWFVRDHVIVCGIGRKGAYLVTDFRAGGMPVVAIDNNANNELLQTCRQAGAIVLVGDASDKIMLRRARTSRAKYFIAVGGSDSTNVETAVNAFELVQEASPSTRRVNCYVHIVDLKLCELFKGHRLFAEPHDPFEPHVFNVYENTARQFFAEHPLDRAPLSAAGPSYVNLVVIGFGKMGESMVLQTAKVGHYATGEPVRITVIDKQADARRRPFCGRHPQIDRVCRIEFVQGEFEEPEVLERIRQLAADPNGLTTVVVCLDNDAACLHAAMSLSHRLAGAAIPLYVRMSEREGIGSLLESVNRPASSGPPIEAFGMMSAVSTRKVLLKDDLDTLARAIHEDFVKKRSADDRPDTDPSMAPWESLDPGFKDSNRQQADHIAVKLRAVGCHSGPKGRGGPICAEFTAEEIECLARMEHDRWNAERFLAGWRLGPSDKRNRISPYLVSWDELPDDIKEYDREAVRNIPRLLQLVGQCVYRNAPAASSVSPS